MIALFFIGLPLLGLLAYFKYNQQFGGKLTPKHVERYAQSPHWNGKKFVNAVPTSMDLSVKDMPKLIREQFRKDAHREPAAPLPVEAFDLAAFNSHNEFTYIWYGHSAFLMKMDGVTFAIDPMMGPDAAPIGPMRTKRFSENTLDIIDNWPPLDAVLFTHDHYDHLDYASIQKLKEKVGHWYVALGVGRHLERWGVSTADITEMDWWDQANLGSVQLTFTPSRHFAGRGPTDRAKSFWGGWVLKTESENIYFTGDGGFAGHFEEVGKRFGPFDLCFTECGQYNEKWRPIHMFPEESVQAAIQSNSAKAIPYHWGGFRLALHAWTDPVEEFIQHAEEKDLTYQLPRLGAVNTVANGNTEKWW